MCSGTVLKYVSMYFSNYASSMSKGTKCTLSGWTSGWVDWMSSGSDGALASTSIFYID